MTSLWHVPLMQAAQNAKSVMHCSPKQRDGHAESQIIRLFAVLVLNRR